MLEREPIDVVIQDMNFRADTTSGEEGVGAVPRDPRAVPRPAGHPADRVDAARGGGRARQGRRRRLPREAVGRHEAAHHRRRTCSSCRERGASCRGGAPTSDRRRSELAQRYDLRGAVFADPAMERVIALACQVARADVPVLITGPNGAGKEKIAEIVQANSAVRDGPFVTLNCGALPSRADRGRAVRRRGRRVHRREPRARGQVRVGRRRHAVPRRDRQPVARPAR